MFKKLTLKGFSEGVLLLVITTIVVYSFSYYRLSQPIEDPTVQKFYKMAGAEGFLSKDLSAQLNYLTEDGFSTWDFYVFNEMVAKHCGEDISDSRLSKLHYLNLGLMDIFSFGHFSLQSILAYTDGKLMVDQLDATLCPS